MADIGHVDMESSVKLLETIFMIFYNLRFTCRTSYNQVMLLLS